MWQKLMNKEVLVPEQADNFVTLPTPLPEFVNYKIMMEEDV